MSSIDLSALTAEFVASRPIAELVMLDLALATRPDAAAWPVRHARHLIEHRGARLLQTALALLAHREGTSAARAGLAGVTPLVDHLPVPPTLGIAAHWPALLATMVELESRWAQAQPTARRDPAPSPTAAEATEAILAVQHADAFPRLHWLDTCRGQWTPAERARVEQLLAAWQWAHIRASAEEIALERIAHLHAAWIDDPAMEARIRADSDAAVAAAEDVVEEEMTGYSLDTPLDVRDRAFAGVLARMPDRIAMERALRTAPRVR